MKRPIDKDFDTIREYMVAMEAYVKFLEGEVDGIDDKITIEPIYFKGAIVEDEQASFEAVVLTEGDTILNDTLTITYTDKRMERAKQKEQYWDNSGFFNGLLEGDDESELSLAGDKLSPKTYRMLIDFLKLLKGLGCF